MRRLLRRLRSERGFTLVELVTSMSILAVVLTGVTALFVAGTHAQSDADRRFQAQTELRVALDKLRREIHGACYTTNGTATETPLSTVTLYEPPSCATVITWCMQGSGTRYGLYRAPGSACTGGTRYADHLTSSAPFTYYGPDHVPTGATGSSWSLARLHVDLTANVDPAHASPYRLVDDIVFRNSPRCTLGVNC